MINKWIKKDKEFVFKGLGSNGQEILREENKKYNDETFLKRKLFITRLIELLENLKKKDIKVIRKNRGQFSKSKLFLTILQ